MSSNKNDQAARVAPHPAALGDSRGRAVLPLGESRARAVLPLGESRGRAVLPLGAVAAGFGFASLAFAQAEPSAATSAALPVVRATASAEAEATASKRDLQAVDTRLGKGKQELRDVPQSITVVTEKLIDDRNLDTLKDALKNTAGISFQAAEGGEEDIRLRGFSLQSTGDIFIDGIRDPAFYDRDSFNWDRLEVMRGSASMLFGRGSTGGAVNQVSKQPFLFDLNEISVTLGSGSYLRGTGDFNAKTGDNAALRVNLMANFADNWGPKTDKLGIAPTYRFGIGTTDEFSVGLYLLKNDNGINYGLPWLAGAGAGGTPGLMPVSTRAYYGMASDHVKGGTTSGTLSHTHRFGGDRELRTSLRIAKYDRDQHASAIRFAPGTTIANFGDATVLRRSGGNGVQLKNMEMDTLYLQSDYSGKHRWFGLQHTVAAGLDLAHERFRNFGVAADSPLLPKPNTTVGTPDDGASIDESLRRLRETQSFSAKAIGIYAQDLLQVSPQWKLLAGLRFDRFDGRYSQPELRNLAGTVTQQAAVRARADSLWSHRLGVLFQPTPFASFHLSYGTSFNTSGDTYRFDALGSNTGPEKSRNIELGAKIDWAEGQWTTRFALFRATKYNERNRDEESVTPTNYALSGKRHAAGFELDIAGRITPQWEIYGSYAFIPVAKIDKGASDGTTLLQGEEVGSRPGLTPRHSGTIWSTYQLTPAWRIGGGLNARGGMKPLQSQIIAPRYITGDLMAEYTHNEHLGFKLSLINVTDKHYADMLYRGHYVQGKPRTLQLTGTYKF